MKIGNITIPDEVLRTLDPSVIQQLQNPQMAQALEAAVGHMQPLYQDVVGKVKSGEMSMDDLNYFNPLNHATAQDYINAGVEVPAHLSLQAAQAGQAQPMNYVNPQTGSPEFAYRKDDLMDKAKQAAQAVARMFTPQHNQVPQLQSPQVQQVVQNQIANAASPGINPAIPVAPPQVGQSAYQPKAMTQQISSAMAGQMMPNRAVLNMPTKTVETFQSSANPMNLMAGGVGSKMFMKNVASSGASTPATSLARMPQRQPNGSFGASQQEDTNPDARDTAAKMISSGMFKY